MITQYAWQRNPFRRVPRPSRETLFERLLVGFHDPLSEGFQVEVNPLLWDRGGMGSWNLVACSLVADGRVFGWVPEGGWETVERVTKCGCGIPLRDGGRVVVWEASLPSSGYAYISHDERSCGFDGQVAEFDTAVDLSDCGGRQACGAKADSTYGG